MDLFGKLIESFLSGGARAAGTSVFKSLVEKNVEQTTPELSKDQFEEMIGRYTKMISNDAEFSIWSSSYGSAFIYLENTITGSKTFQVSNLITSVLITTTYLVYPISKSSDALMQELHNRNTVLKCGRWKFETRKMDATNKEELMISLRAEIDFEKLSFELFSEILSYFAVEQWQLEKKFPAQ